MHSNFNDLKTRTMTAKEFREIENWNKFQKMLFLWVATSALYAKTRQRIIMMNGITCLGFVWNEIFEEDQVTC